MSRRRHASKPSENAGSRQPVWVERAFRLAPFGMLLAVVLAFRTLFEIKAGKLGISDMATPALLFAAMLLMRVNAAARIKAVCKPDRNNNDNISTK